MKKIAILILISLFIMGCKTKKVLKKESQEVYKSEEILKSQTTEREEIKSKKYTDFQNQKTEDSKVEKTDIQITGKVTKDNPVVYYNIIGRDTIDAFKIEGSADFTFKSSKSTQKSSVNNKSSDTSSEDTDAKRSVSNAVENVKKAVKEVQTKTVEVVKKDFTIGSYFVFFLWGLAVIALLILFIWIRKSNPFQFITKYFKK